MKNELKKLTSGNISDNGVKLLLQTIPIGNNVSKEEFIRGQCKWLKLHYNNVNSLDKISFGAEVAYCLINMNEPLEALTFIEDLKHDNSDINEDQYEVILQLKIVSLIFLEKWDNITSTVDSFNDADISIIGNIIDILYGGSDSKNTQISEAISKKFLEDSKRATKSFYDEVICQNKLNKNDTFNVLYFKLIMLSLYYAQWSPKDETFIQEFSLVLKALALQNYDQIEFKNRICNLYSIIGNYIINKMETLIKLHLAGITPTFDYTFKELKKKLAYLVQYLSLIHI